MFKRILGGKTSSIVNERKQKEMIEKAPRQFPEKIIDVGAGVKRAFSY